MTTDPQHVYVVTEINDSVVRRTHGYFASLQGAFGYCETEERKKPLVDSARFELFAAPGGEQWLIHAFYGPEDRFPVTSDFVIRRAVVVSDPVSSAVAQSAPAETAPPTDLTAEEAYRLALSTALGLGTAANWEAIRDRAEDLVAEVAELTEARVRQMEAAASDDRAAVLREEAVRIRAHCPDHLDSNSADGSWMACHCAVADDLLRRMADETQPAEVEAHPPYHRWYVETRDGLANQWAPGMRFADRAEAVTRHQDLNEHHPTWKDGTPVERRLVRETTSYTVEAEPAVEAQQQTETQATTGPGPWVVQMICCGHDDGKTEFATWQAADNFREEYIDSARIADHERSALVRRGEPTDDPHVPAVVPAGAGEEAWDVPDARPGTTDHTLTKPVQHAPGVAIRCADCRAKGHTVCMDDEPAVEPTEAEGDRIVAYRSTGARVLRCPSCYPDETTFREGDLHPVTSEDLPDGGLCTKCGVDVLIPQQPKEH